MKTKPLIKIIFVTLFTVIGGFIVLHQWDECTKQGGDFVRGAVWYKCIK